MNYISEGSFGKIYADPDGESVIKVHSIAEGEDDLLCKDWKHEYETQKSVHEACDPKLKTLWITITFPFGFNYKLRSGGISNTLKESPEDCRIRMERIPARLPPTEICEAKLAEILYNKDSLFSSNRVPPYMYLGSDGEHKGHITLPMVRGSEKVQFIGEDNYYYTTTGIAHDLIKNMFQSFFVIISNGFIPRDIEYVFNSKIYAGKAKTLMSILDFNQVKTLADREKYAQKPYDLEVDIAEVYIDLCGIRAADTQNPYYPSEPPTPQWKFLCNPLLTPDAFINSCIAVAAREKSNFNLPKVISLIVRYINEYYLNKHLDKLPCVELLQWVPSPFFLTAEMVAATPDGGLLEQLTLFDGIMQKIFLFKSFRALRYTIQQQFKRAEEKAGILVNILGKSFGDVIAYLNEINKESAEPGANGDPFNFFGGYRRKTNKIKHRRSQLSKKRKNRKCSKKRSAK